MHKYQLDRNERFEADYNRIDRFLRAKLNQPPQATFVSLVKEYARRHLGWRHKDFLISTAELRNILIHTKVTPYQYLAIPADMILERL